MTDPTDYEFDDRPERKSKSQLKREMHELQALGEELCALAPDKIKNLDLPPKLAEAALFSKTITKHEARRRHMQYMGRLVRELAGDVESEEVAALRRALERIDQTKKTATDEFHKLEQWRDRLVSGDLDCIEEIAAEHPEIDRQHTLTLARNATREAAKNKPPKSSRALFRYLKELG